MFNPIINSLNATDHLLMVNACRLPPIRMALTLADKINLTSHNFVSKIYYNYTKKNLTFRFSPISWIIKGSALGISGYVLIAGIAKDVYSFFSATGLITLLTLSGRFLFWSAKQVAIFAAPLKDSSIQAISATASKSYDLFFANLNLNTLTKGFSFLSPPLNPLANGTKQYNFVPELHFIGETTQSYLEAERAAKFAQSFCPIESGPVNNATITLGQTCPNLFQPVSNVINAVKNVLPSIPTPNFSNICPAETLELANKCIPGMEHTQEIVQTIAKAVPIAVENAKTEIASTPIATTVVSEISSYVPMFGMIVATAAIGYGLFKLYQHYQQPITVTNPDELQDSIDGIEPLSYANEILSGNQFFVIRYICSSVMFAYAAIYSTVRATIHLALTLLLLPGVVFQNGRALIRHNFFQTLLHISAAITAVTGTIFPYAGNALFQAQMRSYYPSLQTLIA